MWGCGLHSSGSVQGPVVRCCEQGSVHSNIGNIEASLYLCNIARLWQKYVACIRNGCYNIYAVVLV